MQNPGEDVRSPGRKTLISSPDQSDDLISNLTPNAMAIALFGTGLLGGAIASRLLEGEQELWVWNRTAERCQSLIQAGARTAPTAQEVAGQADWLVTVLSPALRGRNCNQAGWVRQCPQLMRIPKKGTQLVTNPVAKVTGEMGEHRIGALKRLDGFIELLANGVELDPSVRSCLTSADALCKSPRFDARIVGNR